MEKSDVIVLKDEKLEGDTQFIDVDTVLLYRCSSTTNNMLAKDTIVDFINCKTIVVVNGNYSILSFNKS
jgi:hypothetical protein